MSFANSDPPLEGKGSGLANLQSCPTVQRHLLSQSKGLWRIAWLQWRIPRNPRHAIEVGIVAGKVG